MPEIRLSGSQEVLLALAACARVGNDDEDSHGFSDQAWDAVGDLAAQIAQAADAEPSAGHPSNFLEPSANALWARLLERNGAEAISEGQELTIAALSIAVSAKRGADALEAIASNQIDIAIASGRG